MVLGEALELSPLNRRDTEVLLQHILQVERPFLYAHPEYALNKKQQVRWQRLAGKRLDEVPIAHLIGMKEFYGYEFKVNDSVLIPRPETEELVGCALDWISLQSRALKALEIGTGSGCISITLANESRSTLTIDATDISAPALRVARENWRRLDKGQSAIRFLHADLFDHRSVYKQRPYDLVVANLPYLPDAYAKDGSMPHEVSHEPALALFAGSDGLSLYSKFIQEVPEYLSENGALFIECDHSHASTLYKSAAQAFPKKMVALVSDSSGKPRFVTVS